MNHLLFSILLFTSILLVSCSSVPVNLQTAKEAVIAYHESGQYDKEVNKVIDKAISEFKNVKVNSSSAVIFDVDETTLSNYKLNKKLDFGYIPNLWDKWIYKAKAPAIKNVKRLYDYLIGRGIKIIFLTGRKSRYYNATYKNLKNAGYKIFDTLITRSPKEEDLTAIDYKSEERIELERKGYEIIGTIGDQYSDLDGPYHGIQIKIPNYIYIIK